MAYWTDIFTLETWAQARARDFRVTGFPPPTAGAGGYGETMFSRVNVGDVLLCYCKRPAMRWVGALRVKSDVYQSEDPVWGIDEEGRVRYPWRYEADPIVTLDPARGLDGRDAASQLGFLTRFGSSWGTYLQRSLNGVPDEDGDRLIELLRQDRQPIPIRGAPSRRGEAVAVSLLDVRAEEAPPTSEEAPDEEQPTRIHTEMQGKLRDIGFSEGYDVWVADRGLAWGGGQLGDECLTDLPVVAPARTVAVMKNIDVIWFRGGTGIPDSFFEVEQSTGVSSGLLRFNDVMVDYRIERAFIVGGEERTQRRFEREVRRRTFQASGLAEIVKYLSYGSVNELWSSYQQLGRGSSSWG